MSLCIYANDPQRMIRIQWRSSSVYFLQTLLRIHTHTKSCKTHSAYAYHKTKFTNTHGVRLCLGVSNYPGFFVPSRISFYLFILKRHFHVLPRARINMYTQRGLPLFDLQHFCFPLLYVHVCSRRTSVYCTYAEHLNWRKICVTQRSISEFAANRNWTLVYICL